MVANSDWFLWLVTLVFLIWCGKMKWWYYLSPVHFSCSMKCPTGKTCRINMLRDARTR
jgi:hypothetical protein